ncbi:MAG: alpha/beta hydrolase [Bacteroidetes bacterium]|nr:alpha/beta hydrolase [Bacteroidota bacterium]HET6245052.1 DUF3887 domain-containing protein [Bacteroidia bacterium]
MKGLLSSILFLFICANTFAQDSLVYKSIAQEFIKLLVEKQYDQASLLFDFKSSQKYNPVYLKKTWLGIQSQTGEFLIASEFNSKKNADGNSVLITCEFQFITLNIKTSFDKQNKISLIEFLPAKTLSSSISDYNPPPYVKKRRIKEEEIYFKTDVFLIPGVYTRPKCKRKTPLVILVHDFGPLDRDATLGSNKIFMDLALGLASKGIAVIRYDKRSFVYAARMIERYGENITIMEETISDVISAVNLAKTLKRVDSEKIYVLGHGIGGMVSPRIASMKQDLAGIIIMAGNARPLEDMLLEQSRYLSEISVSQGGLTDAEKIQLYQLEDQIMAVKNPNLNSNTPASELPMNLSSSYWIDMNNYNQISAAKNASIPMLFLQGQRDFQVTLTDFSIWKKELEELEQVSFKLYAELNHMFIEGSGMSVPKEYLIKGNVPGYVITDISKWLKNRKLDDKH